MHIASFDEALGIPTEEAARLAIKTSKVVQHETGIMDVADPLGGSHFVEALTDEIETEVRKLMHKIDEMGGAVTAIETGFIEQEIANASYRSQAEIDNGERIIVGVNDYKEGGENTDYSIFRPNPEVARIAIERVKQTRAQRSQPEAAGCIERIKSAAKDRQPLMPRFIDAVKADVTLGEITQALEDVLDRFQFSAIVASVG